VQTALSNQIVVVVPAIDDFLSAAGAAALFSFFDVVPDEVDDDFF
jgi:hypothetical protein